MTLKEALTHEVNSALLTYQNHSTDNHFLYGSIYEMEKELFESRYEPQGICQSVPFNTHRQEQIGFVYRYEEELYWCHFPKVLWQCLECKMK